MEPVDGASWRGYGRSVGGVGVGEGWMSLGGVSRVGSVGGVSRVESVGGVWSQTFGI